MITVPTKYLKCALIAAAKKDIRHYLNGVLIEVLANETRCVATDGHLACALRHEFENEMADPFIVPRDVVEMAVKMKREFTMFEPATWMMNDTVRFAPIDGKFPDYRPIFQNQVSGEAAQFDPDLFARFGKMADALGKGGSDVSIHQNGKSAAMVSIYDRPEFAGVIMPLNSAPKGMIRPGVMQWVRP